MTCEEAHPSKVRVVNAGGKLDETSPASRLPDGFIFEGRIVSPHWPAKVTKGLFQKFYDRIVLMEPPHTAWGLGCNVFVERQVDLEIKILPYEDDC